MKLFQNKFFIICLCIAVVIAGLSSTFALMGYRSLARDVVGTVTAPLRWVASAVTNAVDGFGRYFSSIDALTKQKEALEAENAALREKIDRAELLEKENERLREYLGMKAEYASFSVEEGMVIGREASGYVTVLTLNRGSAHGIENDMAVITKDGIVGCVTEVGLTWCKVSTLLETARSVGVYLPRTGASGIVSGDYSMKNDGLCKLTFLSEDEKSEAVQPGDVVYSSGIGSVYPQDVRVGVVVSVELDNASRTRIATVRPIVDYSEPDYMMIVTGYKEAG